MSRSSSVQRRHTRFAMMMMSAKQQANNNKRSDHTRVAASFDPRPSPTPNTPMNRAAVRDDIPSNHPTRPARSPPHWTDTHSIAAQRTITGAMRLAWRMQCSSSSLLLLRANSARVFSTSIDLNDPLMKRIHDYVTKDKLVVFMKGTPDAPQCGYSRAVVQILDIMSALRCVALARSLSINQAAAREISAADEWLLCRDSILIVQRPG